MFTEEAKNNMINTTLGWMRDIDDRLPKGVSWAATSKHRIFIEILEKDEGDITFDEWRTIANRLMEFHAMARNDIYDFATVNVRLDADGHFQGHDAPWETVSRQEADVRTLLHFYHTQYAKEEE